LDRGLRYVIALILLCAALPFIAPLALKALPLLFGALALLVIWKLAWPAGR